MPLALLAVLLLIMAGCASHVDPPAATPATSAPAPPAAPVQAAVASAFTAEFEAVNRNAGDCDGDGSVMRERCREVFASVVAIAPRIRAVIAERPDFAEYASALRALADVEGFERDLRDEFTACEQEDLGAELTLTCDRLFKTASAAWRIFTFELDTADALQ